MKEHNTRKAAKREYHLREAKRIFIYSGNVEEAYLLGCYRLIKSIFDGQHIPDNCATISGLINTYFSLSEEAQHLIHLRYFENLTYKEMLNEFPGNYTIATLRLQLLKSLALLREQTKNFYLPDRQKFLSQYSVFFGAIISGHPFADDIPIRQLGLSTRTSNALYRSGVFTASQMYFKTDEELLKIRNLGYAGVEEIHVLKYELLTRSI